MVGLCEYYTAPALCAHGTTVSTIDTSSTGTLTLMRRVQDGVCKLDTDDVAATVVEGNKCGYSFRRVCPAAMRTVPILWAQFKCNEADRCRESTDTAFTTFNDYVLLNGCAYAYAAPAPAL